MLNHLNFTVTFTNPERTITRDLSFEEGLSAITGPNGTGKSLVLEMIQYALHGTDALRAALKEYKELATNLRFQVRDKEYYVLRSLKAVKLLEDDEVIASGTKAVNAAILNIFGYSYDVFKVANVAGQGEIEALGNMAPTERKRLVDETVGLNALDDLTLYIQGEARDLGAEIKAVEKGIVEPIKPVDPGLESPEHYLKAMQETQAMISERDKQSALASQDIGVGPERVILAADYRNLTKYETEHKTWEEAAMEKRMLNRQLGQLKAEEYVPVELDPEDGKLEEYQSKNKEQTKALSILELSLAPPTYTAQQLLNMRAQWLLVKRWGDREELRKKEIDYTCEKCAHQGVIRDPRIEKEYADLPEDQPSTPELSDIPLTLEQRKIDEYPSRLKWEGILAGLPDDYEAVIKRIQDARHAFQMAEVARTSSEARRLILDRLQELQGVLSVNKDRSEDIERLNQNEKARLRFADLRADFEAKLARQKEAAEAWAKFPTDLNRKHSEAISNLQLATRYELERGRYDDELTMYSSKLAQLAALKEELKDWENGKKAIVDLRAKVKGYLLPSLNQAASYLINEMTGGELSWIIVNEDFDITVEGQKLETLSGSGKAVANLALRLSLGQILTNRVFSVVMLDEIDASCDTIRAQYIAGCLQRLTKSIKQVLLVSHKEGLTADHHIKLGV